MTRKELLVFFTSKKVRDVLSLQLHKTNSILPVQQERPLKNLQKHLALHCWIHKRMDGGKMVYMSSGIRVGR